MSLLAKIKTGIPAVAQTPRSLSGVLVHKAELYGAAAAFGYVKGAYREKAAYKGLPVDLLAGIGLTVVAVGAEIMTSGRSKLAPHLNSIADAGFMSYLGSMGAAYGAKKMGRQVYVLNQGAAKPALAPAGMTAVGALPPAVGGAFLSPDQIARFAGQR